jgi:hypothetical protein
LKYHFLKLPFFPPFLLLLRRAKTKSSHSCLRIPIAHDLGIFDCFAHLSNLVLGEPHIYGLYVLLEVLDLLGPRNRDEVVALGENPCQGQLTGSDALFGGDLGNQVDELEVLVEVFFAVASDVEAPVSGLKVSLRTSSSKLV